MKLKILASITLTISAFHSAAQYNCNVFKMDGNEKCYQACLLATEAEQFQGTRDSQIKFDSAIRLCPTFAYAYFEKSVPYIKRGDLKTWRLLIDKAVEHDPLYLGYRGWCRFQFARDYRGALEDFKKLRKYAGDNIGYSQNGDYDLRVVEALCYTMLGETETGTELLEKFVGTNTAPGSFALLHLGVMKIAEGKFPEAIAVLELAISENPSLADLFYYKAVALKELGKVVEAQASVGTALSLYDKGYFRKDAYTNPVHRVYRTQLVSLSDGVR